MELAEIHLPLPLVLGLKASAATASAPSVFFFFMLVWLLCWVENVQPLNHTLSIHM